jgi:hypothetical protein
MKMLATCAAGMAVVAALSQVSSATVVFQDDFEGFSVGAGAFPQAGFDLDPVASVGSWFMSESAEDQVQVTKQYSPVQGTQALALGRFGTGAHFTGAEFAASPAVQSDPLKITFKYKDPSPDGGYNGVFAGECDTLALLGYNKTGGGFGSQVFQINLISGYQGASTLTAGFSGTSLNPNLASRADFTGINFDNDWMDIEVLMDFVNHTYTLKVNGVSTATSTNVPFDAGALSYTSMQQLAFYSNETTGTVLAIDDVKIESIPEPTSLALLGLCGIAALARRRRMA